MDESFASRASESPSGYRFVDYATQAYLAAVGLLILFFHDGRVAGWPWLLAGHAAAMAAIHALVRAAGRRPDNRWLGWLRCFYPLLLYTALYRETSLLNRLFVHHYLDLGFAEFEQRLFGCQPSVRFMEAWPYVWVSELFYLSYFSYYVMIVGVGLALYFRGREPFFHYVSVVSFVFYACYLIYIFLPVLGPPAFFTPEPGFPEQAQWPWYPLAFPAAVQRGPFFQLMKVLYDKFDGPGAAFPSSHVAVALCTLYFTWRYFRPLRWAHLVVVVLLAVSTVYCRYHYVIDVIAGAATAAALVPLGERLYRRC